MEIFTQSLKRLRAFLDLEYKGLNIMPIVLKNQEFDLNLINEITEVTTWLKEHIEVKFANFIFHIDQTHTPKFENEQDYLEYREACKNLFEQIDTLPQIIICDFKGNFENIWCEFIYHSNVTLADSSATFNWNHLTNGTLPFSLKTQKQSETLKNIILTSQNKTSNEMQNETGIVKVYNDDLHRKQIASSIKKNILNSSPTGIIQLKHAFNQDNVIDYEKTIYYTYLNSDWKLNNKFSTVHEMKSLLTKKENDLSSPANDNQLN